MLIPILVAPDKLFTYSWKGLTKLEMSRTTLDPVVLGQQRYVLIASLR